MRLRDIPLGVMVNCVELHYKFGAQLARSAVCLLCFIERLSVMLI